MRLDAPPDNICILRLSALGDATHTVPVVRALQSAWPDTPITWIIGKLEHRLVGGLENVEFRRGQIETLPVDSNTVDVIISNCVINLSPDKQAVFNESFRVLRPGGKLAVSDIVTQGQFTAEDRANMDAWAGCITGAEDVTDYVAALETAGFINISIQDKADPTLELANSAPSNGPARPFSARITAEKPL